MSLDQDIACVLLYYKYVEIGDQRRQVADWFREACQRLELKGRIRVALDGVNVTVGGARRDVLQHTQEVREHSTLGAGEEVDFKLSESHGPLNDSCCVESGFQTLAIRECEELVSLNLKGSAAEASAVSSHAATKLSPETFHSAMTSTDDLVLIDTRNIYEHSIGHMCVEGVETLRPPTRCFSDWPTWLDQNLASLANKRVLMYCTGGVRCERASAYLRSKGTPFSNVQQLRGARIPSFASPIADGHIAISNRGNAVYRRLYIHAGGIERYLEQFPDGGKFQGKNFVFDERVVHPNSLQTGAVVGKCMICSKPHDDYGPRHRCSKCRMLVLVCPACVTSSSSPPCSASDSLPSTVHRNTSGTTSEAATHDTQNEATPPAAPVGAQCLICDICRSRMSVSMCQKPAATNEQGRKLRILALHGFRENASRFRGRLRGLLKRMQRDVEIDFVEAPHVLSSSHPQSSACQLSSEQGEVTHSPSCKQQPAPGGSHMLCGHIDKSAASRSSEPVGVKLFVHRDKALSGRECESQRCVWSIGEQDVSFDTERQGTSSDTKKLEGIPGKHSGCEIQVTGSDDGEGCCEEAQPGRCGGSSAGGHTASSQIKDGSDACKPEASGRRHKYAWFYDPGVERAEAEPTQETLFGQLQRQACGWKESLARIKETVQHRGAYDGILGFSQGCAMALLLLAATELSSSCSATSSNDSLPSSSDCSPSTGEHERVQHVQGGDGMHVLRSNSSCSSRDEASCMGRKGTQTLTESFWHLSQELQQEISLFAHPKAPTFKFALLFSGHRGVCPEAQHIIEAAAPLATPSMHVYGAPGQDQQVPYEASAELPSLFQNAKVLVHSKGHVVPSSKADCQLYLQFAAMAMQGFSDSLQGNSSLREE